MISRTSTLLSLLIVIAITCLGCSVKEPLEPNDPPILVTWEKTFGLGYDDAGYSVVETNDGYVIASTIQLSEASETSSALIRVDRDGNNLWTKTYFENGFVHGKDVLALGDGGFLLLSEGWDRSSQYGRIFLVRTDAAGNNLWQRPIGPMYGESSAAEFVSTPDGGYVVVGSYYDNSVSRSVILVIKISITGEPQWTYQSSGTINSQAFSIGLTSDGGYIVAGYRNSGANDDANAYLVKLNEYGNMVWFRDIGGAGWDYFYSVKVLPAGGFILCGATSSYDADGYDLFLVKTDSTGAVNWQALLGGSGDNQGEHVIVAASGGYATAGYSESDVYITRTNSTGELLWSRVFGNDMFDSGKRIEQTSDGGFIIVGTRRSSDVGDDIYVIKTDAQGLVH